MHRHTAGIGRDSGVNQQLPGDKRDTVRAKLHGTEAAWHVAKHLHTPEGEETMHNGEGRHGISCYMLLCRKPGEDPSTYSCRLASRTRRLATPTVSASLAHDTRECIEHSTATGLEPHMNPRVCRHQTKERQTKERRRSSNKVQHQLQAGRLMQCSLLCGGGEPASVGVVAN